MGTTRTKGLVKTLTVIAVIAAFFIAQSSFAIEGLKLSVQCSNVVLSWPSVEGQTYIIQYRPTLDPSNSWVTLTNSYPADSGTNITFFVHSNIVQNPVCDGGSFSMMMMTGGSEEELSLTPSEPMATLNGTSNTAPVKLYPDGFDFSNFTITVPGTSGSLSGAAFMEAEADDPLDPNGGAEPNGSGDTNSIPLDTGFYQVVQNGVQVLNSSLTNLTSGIVSNTVNIGFEAANYDLGTLQDITVLIDGAPYRGATPLITTNISEYISVDTSFLENGDHSVQLQGSWLNPDLLDPDNYVIERKSDPFTLSVSNEIYYPDWQEEIGELGFAFYTFKTIYTNTDWQIDIYDVSNNLAKTLTGHTDDGIVETNWDLVDMYSVPRTNDSDSEFSAVISVDYPITPHLPTPKPTKKPAPQKKPFPYPAHGGWVIAYQNTFQHFANSNDYYGALYQMGSVASQFGGAYTVFPSTNPTNGQTFPIRYPGTNDPVTFATMALDGHTLENLLTNNLNRNFFYNGHAGANQLAITLDTTWLTYRLKNNYYRWVFIDGCESANGGLPKAFGNNMNAPQPLSYFQKSGLRPRVYMGYPFLVHYGQSGSYIDDGGQPTRYSIPYSVREWLYQFEFYWYFNYTLFDSCANATLSVPYIGPQWDTGEGLVFYGFDDMRIDDYNHQGDWSN